MNSLVRYVKSAAVVRPAEPNPAPATSSAEVKSWSLGKYLRRLAIWWLASWIVIVVILLIVAAHRVSFLDDMGAAALLASLVTGSASADRRAKVAARDARR